MMRKFSPLRINASAWLTNEMPGKKSIAFIPYTLQPFECTLQTTWMLKAAVTTLLQTLKNVAGSCPAVRTEQQTGMEGVVADGVTISSFAPGGRLCGSCGAATSHKETATPVSFATQKGDLPPALAPGERSRASFRLPPSSTCRMSARQGGQGSQTEAVRQPQAPDVVDLLA